MSPTQVTITCRKHIAITRHHHISSSHTSRAEVQSNSLDVRLHIGVPPSVKPRCPVCFPPLLCFSPLLCCSLCLPLLLQVQPAANQWSMHVCRCFRYGRASRTVGKFGRFNYGSIGLVVFSKSTKLNPPKNALGKSDTICTHQMYPLYSTYCRCVCLETHHITG